jgi:hypothetical protein
LEVIFSLFFGGDHLLFLLSRKRMPARARILSPVLLWPPAHTLSRIWRPRGKH